MSEVVHVCCNDWRNGLPDGLVTALEIKGLELRHWSDGCAFREVENGKFRLSRRTFSYKSSKEWVGNWCWNTYTLADHEAKRLLLYLSESGGWTVEAGPYHLCNWFERKRLAA